MLLNDIGKTPDYQFFKINSYLEENYGFKLSNNISHEDIRALMEKMEGEVVDLKLKGDDAKHSPEISKRLLILEAVKKLQENMLMRSPHFETVVEALSEFVFKNFCLGGMSEEDFNGCVKEAMNEYRSCEYRFPDDIVEMVIKEKAMSKLKEMSNNGNFDDIMGEGLFDIFKANSNPSAEFRARRELSKKKELEMPRLKFPDEIDTVSYIPHARTSKLLPDPWEKAAQDRQKGIYTPPKSNKGIDMTEHKHNLVKNLRRLLENQVSQADVIISAKDFSSELQEMIEKIGRLQNEDLPPVTDKMREIFGTDTASMFQTKIYSALQNVMDALYTAKNDIDEAVTSLAISGTISSQIDMEKDMEIGQEVGADVDQEMDTGADIEMGAAGEVGAEEMPAEEPLGREKKQESITRLQTKILEMKKMVEKAKKLKEKRKNK